MADLKARSARQEEAAYIRNLLKAGKFLDLHETDFIGQFWRTGKGGTEGKIYNFGVGGALAVTVVHGSPDATASASAESWRLKDGRLQILAENGLVEHDYRILGYANGEVYVCTPDGGVETYYTGGE